VADLGYIMCQGNGEI